MSESHKYLHLTRPYLIGNGVDIASGGWPVTPNAIQVELPAEKFAWYNQRPIPDTIQWQGDIFNLPFKDNTLDWVYCAKPGGMVATKDGLRAIETIKAGDYVLGTTGLVKVLRCYSMPHKGDMFAVKTSQGLAEITANHPVATPLGWLDAGQLRESDEVFICPTEIEFSKLIDGSDVVRAETCLPPLDTGLTLGVSVLRPALTESENDFGLPSFAAQERNDFRHDSDKGTSIAVHHKPVTVLTPRSDRLCGVHHMNHLRALQDGGARIHDRQVAVSDLQRRQQRCLVLTRRADGNTEATLPVDNSSQPSPIGRGVVHSVSKYTYNGDVVNLETEDGTFYLNGLLTHNSSHLIEDFDRNTWNALFTEWKRVLKPGGVMVILVPEVTRWAAAIARGQPPNCQHCAPEPSVGDLTRCGDVNGFSLVEERLTNIDENDYTIMGVFKKPV